MHKICVQLVIQALAFIWLLTVLAITASSAHGNETYTLDNGLEVTLIDAPGAKLAAIVVLYDIGGDHDPPGKSGLTHVLEHIYVTAATDQQEARDVQEYVQQYPAGWNAQTGAQYTIIATVFGNDRLEHELRDAAARMHNLRIAPSDLNREVPRVIEEVSNMFEGHPQLSAFNNGIELVRPSLHSGRRSGAPDQVRNITLTDLKTFYKNHYRPVNARLIIAAANVNRLRPLIEAMFATIESGTNIGSIPPRPKPAHYINEVITVRASRAPAALPSAAVVALRSPPVNDDAYATFLIVAGRLFLSSDMMTAAPKASVQYPIMDAPETLVITTTVRDGETIEHARSRVDALVHSALHDPVTPQDAAWVETNFGQMLGLTTIHPMMTAQNPYFSAFVTGRQAQMGVDGNTLRQQLRGVSDEELAALRDWINANTAQARLNVIPGIKAPRDTDHR